MPVSADDVRKMREMTGLPMMECKKALDEVAGDMAKAIDLAKQKGMIKAGTKLAGRATADGRVGSYVHSTGKLGALVEIQCETDFVAKSDDFQELLKDICLHVAGSGNPPDYVSREQVPAEFIEKEKAAVAAQHKGKPPQVLDKIVQGNIDKIYERICLVDQPFVKDDARKVGDLVKEKMAKLGENIKIARFARIEVGK